MTNGQKQRIWKMGRMRRDLMKRIATICVQQQEQERKTGRDVWTPGVKD